MEKNIRHLKTLKDLKPGDTLFLTSIDWETTEGSGKLEWTVTEATLDKVEHAPNHTDLIMTVRYPNGKHSTHWLIDEQMSDSYAEFTNMVMSTAEDSRYVEILVSQYGENLQKKIDALNQQIAVLEMKKVGCKAFKMQVPK